MSTPKVSLVTPTRNRPAAFVLLERWVQRWAVESDKPPSFEWIVGTDGDVGYAYTMGQEVVRRPSMPDVTGAASLCGNLMAALGRVRGEIVLVLEDDDWYAPAHLDALIAVFNDAAVELAGTVPAFYYHLPSRRWQRMGNKAHASLSQTAFRRSLIPTVIDICRRQRPFLDMELWRTPGVTRTLLDNVAEGKVRHLGMKGLPGERGIGMGHRSLLKHADASLAWLESQIGGDVQVYEGMAEAKGGSA